MNSSIKYWPKSIWVKQRSKKVVALTKNTQVQVFVKIFQQNKNEYINY